MKSSEMKLRCSVCKYYRLISYADGGLSIGCMKASKNGLHPVDIVALDRCPRSCKKKKDNSADPSELLQVLGKIFAETSPSEKHIKLNKMLTEAGPTVKRRSQLIAKALVELEILRIVSKRSAHIRGNHFTYRWNMKKAGPPSLDMADQINRYVSELTDKRTAREYTQKAKAMAKPAKRLLMDEGATACELCWMRDVADCKERIKAMGFDCKQVNINSIRYDETSVG